MNRSDEHAAVRWQRFNVGAFRCTALLDGVLQQGSAGIVRRFPDADEAAYRRAYDSLGLSLDDAASSFNVLLVETGTATILVDAGEAGRPHGGQLLASLVAAGFAPDAITLVVITHTHGDHVQGLLRDDGSPAFPRASYAISAPELGWWDQRIVTDALDHAPILAMIRNRVRVIAPDEPIVDGVTALPLPGHTPGHIGLRFQSGDAALVHLADVLHSPMQFGHPAWSPTYDHDTSQSVPTRQAALAQAAASGALTLFYHLPFPGLGHVRRQGNAFVWHALPPEAQRHRVI